MSALSHEKAETADASSSASSHARDHLARRLLRKLDLRMSAVVLLYALNYIDRSNAASARLGGFEKDLHLQGNQYATVLSIMYVGFIVMQVPANMFLHWLERPSILIPCSMVIWGVLSALTGITKNYTGVLLARFFLGFAEGPFFPGTMYLISGWYKRDELAVRTTLVSCGSVLSAGFGAAFASGILSGMQGKLGQAAWRWLFYIEGGATVLVALCAFFILPDFPHNTRWLTPEERELAISRLAEDGQGEADERTTMQGLWDALADWKVWWFSIALIVQFVSMSFVSYFPTIVATLGYDETTTLLLAAPPWVLAMITAFAFSRYSDKKRKRFVYVFASNAIAAVGFVVSICTMNTAVRYVSLFLMTQIAGGQMVLMGWITNTFAREPAKRAVAIALILALSQIGGIIGAYVWPPNWGPTYRYSYAVCFVAFGVSMAMFGVMHLHLKRLNERFERDERVRDVDGVRDVGFRYMI